jgi:hypothetical protein
MRVNIPEYVTKEEVRRVCYAIGIRDWTSLTEAKVEIEEAAVTKKLIGGKAFAACKCRTQVRKCLLLCLASSTRQTSPCMISRPRIALC